MKPRIIWSAELQRWAVLFPSHWSMAAYAQAAMFRKRLNELNHKV